MKKFLEGIKYWGQLLLLPVYWFSFLFPRNKNIWLFGSTFGRRFADNPRRLSDEKPSHYVLTTSEFMKPIFQSAFQTKKVSTVGYPRIDGFAFNQIQNIYTEQKTLDKIQKFLSYS